jgi:divalent metal cation (Fe/Co/Zn/Cd) transporter
MIVVFGEQVASMLGLLLALAALGLTMATGDVTYDAIGTLGIGVLLIVVAVFIAVEVKALLIGQSVAPARREAIHAFLSARPEIHELYNVVTLQMGPDVLVAVHARLDLAQTAAMQIGQVNAIEADLQAANPDIRWMFFEADDSP